MNKNKIVTLFVLFASIFVACTNTHSGKIEKVKVGYIVDETGPAASYTDVQKKGISIAIESLEKAGENSIDLIYEDSKLEPKNAINAANKLIFIDKVAVIFTLSSQETKAVMPLADKENVVLLAPLPSSPELSGISKYFFRISPSDALQGKELAALAMKKGYKRAAILYVNDIYGKSLSEAFSKNLGSLGGEVAFSEGYTPKTRDFRTTLIKISAVKPDVVFFPVYPEDAIPLMKQYRELKISAAVFGSDTFSNPSIFSSIPEAAKGVIFASPAKSDNNVFLLFSKRYKEKYGTLPDVNAAAAYDAVMLIAEASRNIGGHVRGDSIRSFLCNLKGYSGATGPIEFDRLGDVVGKKFNLYSVMGRGYEILNN